MATAEQPDVNANDPLPDPDRLPSSQPSEALEDPTSEETVGGREAFLFSCGELAGVTLDREGGNLPGLSEGSIWRFVRSFTLGVRDVALATVPPEPILRGLVADGFFVWRTDDASRTPGTSQ